MLGENIARIRKEKGLTQEALAAKLNIVRQAVSKWENGTSVPDAETLCRIADALEVGVSELLGRSEGPAATADNEAIANTLSSINEQLAVRNRQTRRIWKTIGIVLAAFVLGYVLLTVCGGVLFSVSPKRVEVVTSSGETISTTTIGGADAPTGILITKQGKYEF